MAASASRERYAYRLHGSNDPWTIMRRTGGSLTIASSTVRSDEVRSDRTRGDQKTVTLNPNGTIDTEFSAENYDIFIAAALGGQWSGDRVQNGIDVPRFDFLKSFTDIDEHIEFQNCVVGQMQISGSAGQKITGQLTIMGEGHDDNYDPSGDTFVEPEPTIFMDMSNNFGNVLLDGAPLTGTCLTAFTTTINGNFQSDQCAGSLYQHHTEATLDISGSFTLRYTSEAMDLWRKSTTSAPISFGYTLSDDAYGYTVNTPRAFVSGDLPSGGGVDSGVLTQELSYTAARDSNGVMLAVDRTVPEEVAA